MISLTATLPTEVDAIDGQIVHLWFLVDEVRHDPGQCTFEVPLWEEETRPSRFGLVSARRAARRAGTMLVEAVRDIRIEDDPGLDECAIAAVFFSEASGEKRIVLKTSVSLTYELTIDRIAVTLSPATE